jgi:hypothetical protein
MSAQQPPPPSLTSSEDTLKAAPKSSLTNSDNSRPRDARTVSVVTHEEVFSEPDDAGQDHDEGSDGAETQEVENDGSNILLWR